MTMGSRLEVDPIADMSSLWSALVTPAYGAQVVGGFQYQLNWTSTHPIKGLAAHFSQLYKPHSNGTMIIVHDNHTIINWSPWAIALFWAATGALISSLTIFTALYLRCHRRARAPPLSSKDLEASSVKALDRPM